MNARFVLHPSALHLHPSASACASAASSPSTSAKARRFPRAGRAMTTTSQPSARAAWSFSAVPPAVPLSLVTNTPTPKARMCRRLSSTENGPRPAMICSGRMPARRQASSDCGWSSTRTVKPRPVRRACSTYGTRFLVPVVSNTGRPRRNAATAAAAWSATNSTPGAAASIGCRAKKSQAGDAFIVGDPACRRVDRDRIGMGRIDDRADRVTIDEFRQAAFVQRAASGPRCCGADARFQRDIGRLRNQHAIAGLGQA